MNRYGMIGWRWLLFIGGLFAAATMAQTAPQRVISLAPHLTEWVYLLGQENRLVGVSEHSDYPPAARSLPTVANYYGINIEHVIRLKPDLILAWRSGNRQTDLDKLATFGIPIFYSQPVKPTDIATELAQLGTALGVPQQAAQQATQYRQQLEALQQHYQQRTELAVFYEMWPDPLTTANNNSWIGHLLTLCHAHNIFADAPAPYPQISLEQVLQRQPQTILLAGEQPQHSRQRWAKWPQLPAVKQQHIYDIDSQRLHRFSPRLLGALSDMCQKIDSARRQP